MAKSEKVLGMRYVMRGNIIADIYLTGTILLRRGLTLEFFSSNGEKVASTRPDLELRQELGNPINLGKYIPANGKTVIVLKESVEVEG